MKFMKFNVILPMFLLCICTLSGYAQSDATQETQAMPNNSGPLPHARGKFFSNLDEYLAHLKELGAMDIPYYELQADGRYRLITGRGGNRVPPVFITREELVKKFGFSE